MTTQEIVTVVLYGVLGLISLISGIVNYVRTGKFREEVRFTTLQALRQPTNGVIDWSSLFGSDQSVSSTSIPASPADWTEELKKANLYAQVFAETPSETPTETPTEEERYNVEQSIISIYEDIQRVVDNVEFIRSQLKKKE